MSPGAHHSPVTLGLGCVACPQAQQQRQASLSGLEMQTPEQLEHASQGAGRGAHAGCVAAAVAFWRGECLENGKVSIGSWKFEIGSNSSGGSRACFKMGCPQVLPEEQR